MRYIPLLAIPILSACGIGFFKYDSLPVVRATVFTTGATKQSVMNAGGPPDSMMITSKIRGSCLNYTLRKDGYTSPFFVALNRYDQVVEHGYMTCQEADSRITSDRPL
ncbi:hypothetical protein QVN42_15670 [Yersinia nurmii]|uniref:DNA-binding transcriptional activator OsmE n=1 Tax=Yersinia nurmii TaxID=685706 RepID=A0AAW7K0E0_9GAMM|nr:hypothetical protein [Yersinia nurmii]MDN0088792.1 hypothetical protein [Yersinia nurmii]CNE35617.1 DNA-binding transcriptional activator OsmE [Yersinia nurmii]